MKSKWFFIACFFLLVLMGCWMAARVPAQGEVGQSAQSAAVVLPMEDPVKAPQGVPQGVPQGGPQEDPIVGISNPAAVYCSELGYQYQAKTDPQTGQETGICRLPDNSACDEWDFLAGKCGQGYSYCARNGYQTNVKKDGRDPFAEEYAECVDKTGKAVGSVSGLFKLDEKIKKSGCSGALPGSAPAQAGSAEDFAPIGSPLEKIQPDPQNSSMVRSNAVLAGNPPASFDWRSIAGSNWLTPVKNQAGCGSCWAFAAVGAAEAAHNIASDNPNLDLDLSEQYLVSDCSGAGSCCGGSSYGALEYIQYTGIPDEACLPYADSVCECGDSGCSTSCAYHTGSQCSNRTCGNRCTNYASRLVQIEETGAVESNADAMKRAIVERGPVVIYVYMNGSFDANRVYRCSTDGPINHAVVAVGYNDAGGYWIVRNSWGSSWNGDGYFKVGYGECSAEVYPQYASLAPRTPPAISSLSPSSIEAGSAAFTLTVNGANFTTGSVVRWNNTDLVTSYISSQKLEAQIQADAVATVGTVTINVNDLPPGGGISNGLPFAINSSTSYFSKRSPASETSGLFPEVRLEWDSLAGAVEYEYCLDKVGDGSCSDWRSTGTATSTFPPSLDPNTKYFWQARAIRQGIKVYANRTSAAYWNFTTIPSSSRVLINEVHSLWPVHIELYNGSSAAVNLSGWKLQTYKGSGIPQTYTFGSFSLPAGGYVTLHAGSGSNTAADRYLNYTIDWYGSIGAISLVNTQGNGIDYVEWGSANSSRPDGATWAGPNSSYPQTGSVLGRIGSGIDTDRSQDWCIQLASAGSRNNSCSIPAEFDKYYPKNGAADAPIDGLLMSYGSTGASRYLICLDTVDDDTCNTTWEDEGYATAGYYDQLRLGVPYYWQVLAVNGSHQVEASGDDWWHFTPMAYLPDRYEVDNDMGQAGLIASGSPQTHSIVPAVDEDWVSFTLPARSHVRLETSGDFYADTQMWLFDSSLTELEFDDDDGEYTYSYIDRPCGDNALPAGTYYVKVNDYYSGDTVTAYQLYLTAQTCKYVYLPGILR